MPVIALDLGGTKLAAALFDTTGKILSRSTTPLNQKTGRQVGQLVQEQIVSLCRTAVEAAVPIEAAGVCVPGISYEEKGTVWAPNIPGWNNYPLKREIEEVLRSRLPRRSAKTAVRVESDRACYILGEEWQGVAAGASNAIFMAVGTGIGAGILIDGRVVNGAHGTAGSVGWMALQRPFLPEYVGCGCYEYHASGTGIGRAARETPKGRAGAGTRTAHEVFESFQKGEPLGCEVIRQAVQFWGMAVANLVSLFDPEIIIFGGGVFGPARRLLKDIRLEALKWAQPIAMRKVRLAVSALGTDAGLYGAARVALNELSHRSSPERV